MQTPCAFTTDGNQIGQFFESTSRKVSVVDGGGGFSTGVSGAAVEN